VTSSTEDRVPRPVVVAPTYNNAATLSDILDRIAALGLPVIAVNDGSTDGTAELLQGRARPAETAITHPHNRGKAAALNAGFRAAIDAGYTHAITIDTDGQLDPEEISSFLDAARAHPTALIVGRRDDGAPGYPARSRAGRRVSNLLVRLECGLRVDDSQCGFRVYPLDLIAALKCRVGYYGFETEVITRAGWAGCRIVQVPVTCRYLPDDRRVSHFRPCMDTLRGARMHLFLLGRAMCPLPRHPRWPAVEIEKPSESLWRRFVTWIDPVRAWRQLKQSHVGRSEVAAGLAVGVFIGNLPAYGLQSLISLYSARRLHLHPLPVLLGSHVSTPPVGPLLVMAAIGLGHLLLHGRLPALADFDVRHAGWWRVVRPLLIEWSLGAVILGFFMSIFTFIFANAALRWVWEREAVPGTAPEAAGQAAPAAPAATAGVQ
jgi:uncharacterized protein (DUF2062 family)